MNAQEKRQIAAGAARSEMRRKNIALTLDNAKAVLDDLARTEPELIASQWWLDASDNQYRLFCQEWQRQLIMKKINPTRHGGKRKGAGRKRARFPKWHLRVNCTRGELTEIQDNLTPRQRALILLIQKDL